MNLGVIKKANITLVATSFQDLAQLNANSFYPPPTSATNYSIKIGLLTFFEKGSNRAKKTLTTETLWMQKVLLSHKA